MTDKTNDFLEGMLKESEDKVEALNDDGHLKLLNDTMDLLNRVQEGKYHDFHRNGEDAPKVALVQILEALITNVKNGQYDN